MRWNSFGRSALFAALAGAAYLPVLVLVGPLLGFTTAATVYLTALVTCYVAGLSPGRRFGTTFVVGALGLALVAAADSPREFVLILAVILGITRSGLLYPSRSVRTIATEAVLVGGGLAFAVFLRASSPFSTALAIWGFFLVQSFFFLCRDTEGRSQPNAERDPFESAYVRAVDLLDDAGF